MFNIGKILKRSWQILWSYRVLWIFGLLLALTMGGNGGGSNSGSRTQFSPENNANFQRVISEDAPQWVRDMGDWVVNDVEPLFTHPEQHIGTFVLIGLGFLLFVLVCSAIAAVVRYPSETAVIRMVDEYEQSGTKMKFGQGWKMGWNRRAFRLWVIDLIMAVPALLLVLIIGAVGLVVLFGLSSAYPVNTVGMVVGIGLGSLAFFLLIVVAIFLSLLRNFFVRAAALEDLGVIASLQHGWAMFKRNWKNAGLVWLVMAGIGIGFGIATIIVFFLLIPAYLILLIPAGLVAAIPGMLAYGVTSIFAAGPLAWIIAILAAIPFFFIVLFLPLFLVDGWFKIFSSNVWTLTYREIKAIESLKAADFPPRLYQHLKSNLQG